jgi:hypothetical protein
MVRAEADIAGKLFISLTSKLRILSILKFFATLKA